MRPIHLIALWLGGTALASPATAQHVGRGHDPARGPMGARLERQLEQVREATVRYRDHAAAVAERDRRQHRRGRGMEPLPER